MKKQFDIKKLVLLNLPYLLMGLFVPTSGRHGGWLRGQMLRKNSFPCLPSCLGRCKVSGPACTRWICWWGCAAVLVCVWGISQAARTPRSTVTDGVLVLHGGNP